MQHPFFFYNNCIQQPNSNKQERISIHNKTDNNCYNSCRYYFYFDENDSTVVHCTEENSCPENYKLVHSTTKCVKNCQIENLYDY